MTTTPRPPTPRRALRTLALAVAVAAATALAGCSSFNVGGFCYMPHGTAGQCQVVKSLPAQ